MTVRLVGDSHLEVIGGALRRGRPRPYVVQWVSGRFIAEMSVHEEAGGLVIELPVRDGARIARVDPGDILVLSAPFHFSRLARYPDWLTHRPIRLPPVEGSVGVTDEEVALWVRRNYGRVFDVLGEVKARGIPVAVLETPRLLPRVKEFWKGDAAVPAEVDAIMREAVRETLDELGVPVIATPPETHDGRWTKPEFASVGKEDVHHGNARYGDLMLERIEAWVATVDRARASRPPPRNP